MADLKPGMTLEGVVTNVAAFGAFVDIGVHQDGLVHVSAMSHYFVKDPREVVKSGDVVKVKVLEVDYRSPTHRADVCDSTTRCGAAGEGTEARAVGNSGERPRARGEPRRARQPRR